MTEDVISVAAFTARDLAGRLVQIQRASSVHRTLTVAMRREAVKTVVETLWRRYQRYSRRKSFKQATFLEWLCREEHMENTFWHGDGAGLSLAVRRRMAIRYHDFFFRKELSLNMNEGEIAACWAFTALGAALNMKQPDDRFIVEVTGVIRDPIVSRGLKDPGDAFLFFKSNRTPDDETDWLKVLNDAVTGVWPQD